MGRRDLDKLILLLTVVLVGIGITMVYSTSYIVSVKKFGDGYFFLKRHLLYGALAILMMVVVMRVPYNLYRKAVYPFLIVIVILLVMVIFSGFGLESGGSTRWIRIGFLSFQPSEFAKLAIIMYLAYFYSTKKEKTKTFKVGFIPPAIIGAFIIGLIVKEPDFGSALFIGVIIFSMMFVAGVRFRYLVGTALVSMPILYIMIAKVGYRWNRVMAFLHPWEESDRAGFQIIQSFLALGSGGIWGEGLGEGKQKLFFLPEAHTDFILAVIGEELGLVGIAIIILLYMLFLWIGLRIALGAPNLFGTYLAVGITFLIIFQALLNMGVVTGLLPPKGLTLPFISYGGTSLLVNTIGVGILLNIYNEGHKL